MAGAMLAQPGLASVIQAAGQGLGVLFLKFGRDQESQADMLGFRYMMRTKYDPREADNVFEMFSRMEAASGSARLPDWQSTHPAPEGRVEKAKGRADTVTANLSTFTVGRSDYLRHIDGLVVGTNPRNGYFEGDRFYQPDLALQIDFPPGWKHQNTARSVLAAPEAGDAMIQVQFAEGTPQEAAQKFFSGQGIEGQAQNTTVNGLQATGGNFTAQTESGVLEGAVLFVAHKNRTYRLAGFAPQGKGAAYAEQIRTSLRSFKPVTDSKVLNVKPNRIKLERVPSQMTLEQFNQRFPSVVELSQLALMNGYESGAVVLSAGDYVKRVINR
jgi:predicted Zn-dependent protease